ncbi:MAG: tRNA lysidine(34) synthetase TilS [Acidobacteria bacterium]|nr:tRNA lysidine(34) synthetase TilS [Acidobacteriota bacterium]
MSTIDRASLRSLSGHRVAAAVSGGADSVAMALWLRAHSGQPPHNATLVGLIHVNHHLRGAESDRDETFCRALANRLGVPIDVVDAPIAPRAARSPEAAARASRYRAFAAAAARLGATRVVTAHTADDQAETVLLRLLRGTGSRGLSGIRAARGLYVRPLLACRRRDVRAWLEARDETCCEDSSNADRSIARNRVRHDLLPVIEQMAPGGVAALARAAALAEDDEQALQALAIEAVPAVVLHADTDGADLERDRLQSLAPAIARRVLRDVLERLVPHAPWRADHFEAVRRLAARNAGGGSLDLPAVRVERVSNILRVRIGAAVAVPPFAYTLAPAGDVAVSEAGLRVTAEAVGFPATGASESGDEAYSLVVPLAAFPLTVRNRRPGDRVALSGGARKVQDLMVDAKIPRSERDRVPLVVAADGQILWMPGRSAAGLPNAGLNAVDMVTLRFRKLERT